ncbi:MAG: hypothetical protein IEMM0002_0006 [bacterium]|nr:MAG: hypothetical protein IEMM0002_0006 [bacterium]
MTSVIENPDCLRQPPPIVLAAKGGLLRKPLYSWACRFELMRYRILSLLVFVSLFSCVTSPGADASRKNRVFEATAYEYNVKATPPVRLRRFRSLVSVFSQDQVVVIEIKNFVRKKAAPDVTVKIVRTGVDVASVVVNDKMQTVAEYTRGTMVNSNLYKFTKSSGKRTITGRWFIETDYMMSDFTLIDQNGALLYKETVIYRAEKPVKAKRQANAYSIGRKDLRKNS